MPARHESPKKPGIWTDPNCPLRPTADLSKALLGIATLQVSSLYRPHLLSKACPSLYNSTRKLHTLSQATSPQHSRGANGPHCTSSLSGLFGHAQVQLSASKQRRFGANGRSIYFFGQANIAEEQSFMEEQH